MFMTLKRYLFPIYEIKRKLVKVQGTESCPVDSISLKSLIELYGCSYIIYENPEGKRFTLNILSQIYNDREILFNIYEEKNNKDPFVYDVDINDDLDTVDLYLVTKVSKSGYLTHS